MVTAERTIAPNKARKTMKLISVDAGNFEIKMCSGSEPVAIRSVFKKFATGNYYDRHDAKNPIIELASGDRFALGYLASLLPGSQPIATTRKEEYALLSVLSTLTPELCSNPLKLVFSHFQPEIERQNLTEQLYGTHRFKRNGKPLTVEIEHVEIIPEGMGSFWAAKSRGLLPESGLTLLVDVGGGSYLARMIDQEGYEVAPAIVSAKGGTVNLAQAIASDGRLVQALHQCKIGSIKTAPIMDAFAQETYRYAETGVSFKDWMHEHVDSWFQSIIDEISTAFENYNDRVTKVLFTGGASNIIKAKVQGEGIFCLMPKASMASVVGAYEHYRGLVNVNTEA